MQTLQGCNEQGTTTTPKEKRFLMNLKRSCEKAHYLATMLPGAYTDSLKRRKVLPEDIQRLHGISKDFYDVVLTVRLHSK
jgi:hypothetical protein